MKAIAVQFYSHGNPIAHMNAIYLMFQVVQSKQRLQKKRKKSPFNYNLNNNTKCSQGSDIRNTITLRKKKKTTLIQIKNYTNQRFDSELLSHAYEVNISINQMANSTSKIWGALIFLIPVACWLNQWTQLARLSNSL